MQDAKFDLFVNRADKKELEELVKDTEPFNLLPLKYSTVKQKNIKAYPIQVFRKDQMLMNLGKNLIN